MLNHFEEIANKIEEGEINPLEIFKQVKAEYDAITYEFERIKEMALCDAESRGKAELEQEGYELRNGRKIFKYEQDKKYAKIKSILKQIES